jgi:putative ABC transport system permease protein
MTAKAIGSIFSLLFSLRGVHRWLTLLGAAWGIASILVLVSLANGYEKAAMRSLMAEGKTHSHLEIDVWAPDLRKLVNYPSSEEGGSIAEGLKAVKAATVVLRTAMSVSSSSSEGTYIAFGCLPSLASVHKQWVSMEAGRFICDYDVESHARVVVLGYAAALRLFAEPSSAVREVVFIENEAFVVVGVFAKEAPGFYGNLAIPYTTFSDIAPPYIGRGMTPESGGSWCTFHILLMSPKYWAETSIRLQKRIADLLSIPSKPVRVNDYTDVQVMVEKLARMYYFVFASIGLVTTVIGAMGIANIMLVSVRERLKEIGVRRAVGATSASIGWMFMVEALVSTMVGGIIGFIVGIDVVALLRTIRISKDFPIPEASLTIVLIAFLVNIAAGLLAGVYPALVASRANPIECLRSE